jgi:acyl dehydratase
MSTERHEHTWQDLEAAIGQDFSEGVTRTGADPAERGAIRRFCEALEMDCPLFFDDEVARSYGHAGILAPISMINSTLTAPAIWKPGDPTRWPSPERNAITDTLQTAGGRPMPIPPTSAGFATDIEIEYFRPVHVGDRLTAGGQKLVSVNVRETSVGQGAFYVTEGEIHNQVGDLVARTRNGLYRYNPHPEGTSPPRRPGTRPSSAQAKREVAPPAQASNIDWSVQRYYEDVQEGDSVPPVVTNITVQRLVIEAGANRDFTPIHHNSQIAQSQAAPEMYANNIFIQGMWERAVREFIGMAGTIKKVGPFRMRIFNTVGESVVTKGTVKRRWQEDGESFLELDMLSEHSQGVSVGQGPVVVTLPSQT